jgi:protein-tyrosine phosphatase
VIPLVDIHCHLLAGVDDGPRTEEEALEMCRLAYADGIRTAAATAHQSESWPQVTPTRIREATRRLAESLRRAELPLTVFPVGEVMVHPDLQRSWQSGALLSIADRRKYLLMELPHNLFVDLGQLVRDLIRAGVRPILAHAEREPVLLHERGPLEALVAAGCLIQVNSDSVSRPGNARDQRALKAWFRRGLVHAIGSDAHSPSSRPPRMAEAYQRIVSWAGTKVADQVCSTNAMAILYGLPLHIAPPRPRRRAWFFRFWR